MYLCMHIYIFICQLSEKLCHINEVYHFLIIYSLITYLFCSLRLSISALAKKKSSLAKFSDTHMLISHLMKYGIMKITFSFYVPKLKWTQNKILLFL